MSAQSDSHWRRSRYGKADLREYFQEGGDGAEASSLTGNLLIVDIRNRPVLLAQKKSCCLKPGLSVRNSQGVAFLLCFLLSRLLLGLQLCALFLGQFSGSCSRWPFHRKESGYPRAWRYCHPVLQHRLQKERESRFPCSMVPEEETPGPPAEVSSCSVWPT